MLPLYIFLRSEFYPPSVSPQSLAQKWNTTMSSSAAGNSGSFNALVVQGANHKVEDSTAQTNLVRLVMDLLRSIVASPASSATNTAQTHLVSATSAQTPASAQAQAQAQAPTGASTQEASASGPAPSFDEIVELISTGQADSIPGIRNIPLKVSKSGARPHQPPQSAF